MRNTTNYFTWRVLRTLKRATSKSKPYYPLGSELRLEMSRATKDGSFLTDLVNSGLIKSTSLGKLDDNPFNYRYALTEAGEFMAEHGVAQYDMATNKYLPGIAEQIGGL